MNDKLHRADRKATITTPPMPLAKFSKQIVNASIALLCPMCARAANENRARVKDLFMAWCGDVVANPPQNPPGVTPPPAEEKKPVYKKWWFWTAVGGAAVAVGLGVGLGVGLTRPKAEPFVDVIWR